MTAAGPTVPGRQADEAALHALSVAYADAADSRDGDRFAALFVEDGELVVPRVPEDLRPVVTRSGSGALRKVPEGLRRFDRTFHQVTNSTFTVAGDRASGDVQCVAHHLSIGDRSGRVTAPTTPPPPPATDTVWYIRYRDDYARLAVGWRFARRVLHLQWVEERAVGPVGPPFPPAS